MTARPLSSGEVRRLTTYQRDLLVDHIDGEMDVVTANRHLTGVRNSLMRVGLLKGATPNTNRPRCTVLTERGRMAVGMILGECADALVRAGLLKQRNPLQVLRDLKDQLSPDGEPVPISALLRGKVHC